MPSDLHQAHAPRRSLACAFSVALAGALVIAAAAARANDGDALDAGAPPAGPRPCAIDGRASVPALEITRRGRFGHDIVARMDLPPREIRVEVLSPSLFHVTTRIGEPAVDGHTHSRPPLQLRRDLTLGGISVMRGASVVRLSPRELALDVDLELGAGTLLRRLVVSCEVLRVRESAAPPGPPRPSPRGPTWRARGRELAIRGAPEEGIEALRLALPASLTLHEQARTDRFVRVAAELPYAQLDGWVRDSALTAREEAGR